MTTLLSVLQAVKENTLDREQIEQYRDQLCSMYADMRIEAGNLEKQEAIFYMAHKTEDNSTAQVKYEWKVTTEGQRLILLKAYIQATAKVIDSLKSRIYSKIY